MAKEKTKKIKRIAPHTKYWEKLANKIARECVTIVPCSNCGNPRVHPRVHGFCCNFCDN